MYAKENRRRDDSFDNFSELSKYALENLKVQGKSVVVCGPITTGGQGCAEANIKAISKTIAFLKETGEQVFDNVPYETSLWHLKDKWEKENGRVKYCMPILEEFYLPIYESKLIVRAYFLPDWQTSIGAKWEYQKLSELGIKIVNLSEEEVRHILSA